MSSTETTTPRQLDFNIKVNIINWTLDFGFGHICAIDDDDHSLTSTDRIDITHPKLTGNLRPVLLQPQMININLSLFLKSSLKA